MDVVDAFVSAFLLLIIQMGRRREAAVVVVVMRWSDDEDLEITDKRTPANPGLVAN